MTKGKIYDIEDDYEYNEFSESDEVLKSFPHKGLDTM